MDSKTSALGCDSPYHIYGGEENIYETIKKRKQPLPEMYDEVFQSKLSRREFEAQQVYDTNCDDGLSTYGEFRERKCIHIIRKLYDVIPLWIKIAIPIITICVTVGITGILITENKCLTNKVNKSIAQNTKSSSSAVSTTTTARSYASTVAKVATTVSEEATTTETTWNYTNKSWYIKSGSPKVYYCDTWELISTVKFQRIDMQGRTCHNTLDCIMFIDVYKLNSKGKANYTFYIDQTGNIYEGRDWYCPYVSGELWVALITKSFNILKPWSQPQLRHFYQMVSYKRAFEYFDDNVEEEFVRKCSLISHTSSDCMYE